MPEKWRETHLQLAPGMASTEQTTSLQRVWE